MPKIDRNGRVSYEADAVPPAVLEEKLEAAEAEIAELKAEQAAPAALEVTVAAPHAEPPRPHVPPRLPPRRPPVPKGGGDA